MMNRKNAKVLSLMLMSMVMDVCAPAAGGPGLFVDGGKYQTFAPAMAGPWGYDAGAYKYTDDSREGDAQVLVGSVGSRAATPEDVKGKYAEWEVFSSVYGHRFGSLALMDNKQAAKLKFGASTDTYEMKNRHEFLEKTDALSDFAKNNPGLNLGTSATIDWPAYMAVYAPESTPLFAVQGRKTVRKNPLGSMYKAGDASNQGAQYDVKGALGDETYKDLDAGNTIELKTPGKEVSTAHMLGMSRSLDLATKTKDGVVVDTGISVKDNGTDAAGNPQLYKMNKMFATKDDIGGHGAGTWRRSNALEDTLFGRSMAALGAAMPLCHWPTTALYAPDYDATSVPGYTSEQLADNKEAKMALIRMWKTYAGNFDSKDNPLPFYKAGEYAGNKNTEDDALKALVDDLYGTDSLKKEAANDRIMGIIRKIAPEIDTTATVDGLLDIYVPEKSPGLFDADVFLSIEKYTDQITFAATDADLSGYATYYSKLTAPNNTASNKALIDFLNSKISAAAAEKKPAIKFLIALATAKSSYIDLTGTNGFTTDDYAKAGTVATLMQRFKDYNRTLDTATLWNADLVDSAKQLLQNTKLALYIPGKKVQFATASGTAKIDGKYADGKQMWVPDYEEAYKGSTFGTVLGANTLDANITDAISLSMTGTGTDINQDARRALLLILDCCRAINVTSSFNSPISVTSYKSGTYAISSSNINWTEKTRMGLFKYALDNLRFNYSACAARFNEIMKALDAANVTWTVKPTSFAQCFMYGGANLGWQSDTTSTIKGTGIARTGTTADTSITGMSGIVANSKAWLFGNYNSSMAIYDAANAKGAMPIALVPTEIRGPAPAKFTELTTNLNVYKPMTYLGTDDGTNAYEATATDLATKPLFTDELRRQLTGTASDMGQHEWTFIAPEILHLLQTVKTNLDEVQNNMNRVLIGG